MRIEEWVGRKDTTNEDRRWASSSKCCALLFSACWRSSLLGASVTSTKAFSLPLKESPAQRRSPKPLKRRKRFLISAQMVTSQQSTTSSRRQAVFVLSCRLWPGIAQCSCPRRCAGLGHWDADRRGPFYFKWISNAPPSVFQKAGGFVPDNRDEISLLDGNPPSILKNTLNEPVCRFWFAFPAKDITDVRYVYHPSRIAALSSSFLQIQVEVPKALRHLYDKPKYVYLFTVPGTGTGYYYSTKGFLNNAAEVGFTFQAVGHSDSCVADSVFCRLPSLSRSPLLLSRSTIRQRERPLP